MYLANLFVENCIGNGLKPGWIYLEIPKIEIEIAALAFVHKSCIAYAMTI